MVCVTSAATAAFCPHAGLPYKDKFTLYWTKDFEDSTNVGFETR